MTMQLRADRKTLREHIGRSERLADCFIWSGSRSVALSEAVETDVLPDVHALTDRSVAVVTRDPLASARAFVELDGVARRVIICPPDVRDDHLALLAETSRFDAMVVDHDPPAISGPEVVVMSAAGRASSRQPHARVDTEWAMFTSGTTGAPKLAVHTLEGLTGAIEAPLVQDASSVWATFYDIRRYGGLQILLRALLGRTSLMLAGAGEDATTFMGRLARHGATHITGTPSHWRSALMSSALEAVQPDYVRLSGEIADQQILDALKAQFPGVPIVHAYASTEAGVAFEVDDGLEGFPASLLEQRGGPVELRLCEGVLQVRSNRTARRYLDEATELVDAEGFVDTGDFVERRGDRLFFAGRRGGIINVGGLKVHPEEVEAVINRHPDVNASRVKGRRNPISGMVVVADVVLGNGVDAADEPRVRDEILSVCDRSLARFKVPMRITFVDALPITAGGKLERI